MTSSGRDVVGDIFCRLAWGALVAATLVAGAGCRRPQSTPSDAEPPPGPRALFPAAEVFEPSPLAPGERLPLVIFLHGFSGSGTQLFRQLDLPRFGRAHHAFVVAPDGTLDRSGRRFWNAGPACCNLDRMPVDDVARLAALIDWWRSRPAVDPRRIYIVGFSNGGFMAHRLACTIGERLAAVASISGAGPANDAASDAGCSVSSPIGVLEVHGDADGVVRYQGGRLFDDPSLAVYPAAPEVARAWSRRLGCADSPRDSLAASHGVRRGVRRYDGCARGGVQLWTIAGGDHRLPSPAIIDEIWTFLGAWIKPDR